MAQLLGNKFCIESLRNDVTDIQGTVIDVFSRAGPAQFPSWKYPDKKSCDIDMTDLLETYDYSEDEEERQVAHIVLLEMVVDRYVLIIITTHTSISRRDGWSVYPCHISPYHNLYGTFEH